MSLVTGLLNQNITSISSYSKDVYGDKTYTVIYQDVPCRWQEILEQELLPTGESITYTIIVWFYPDISIRRGYKIIKDSTNYIVQKISVKYDLDGNADHIQGFLN